MPLLTVAVTQDVPAEAAGGRVEAPVGQVATLRAGAVADPAVAVEVLGAAVAAPLLQAVGVSGTAAHAHPVPRGGGRGRAGFDCK